MLFSDLLKPSGVVGVSSGSEAEILRLTDDSRQCGLGACFVAIRGCAGDGHQYIPNAIDSGVSAIVCEDAHDIPPSMPCMIVDDTRLVTGPLGQALLDWPARKLVSVGITGTNGKTTVTALVREILERAGRSCASLGTLVYDSGAQQSWAATTTAGPLKLAELTSEMVSTCRTHLVMEVSSHALDQCRTGGIDFKVGVFTNLTGDHLDYHKTAEAYLAAKRKLFTGLSADAFAIVNFDDPAGAIIAADLDAKVISYGIDGDADISAEILSTGIGGWSFNLKTLQGEVEIQTNMIGRHNVPNLLAAAGAALVLGIDLETVAAALSGAGNVRGRLELVDSDAPYSVFVDYAHTDDALRSVLVALRGSCSDRGTVSVVFGCGGDRDRTKRPRMAKVAQEYADRIYITSDNPRTEEPGGIISEVAAGLDDDGLAKSIVEPDRRLAIRLAVAQARRGDVVLVAGKGHETYQILGDKRIHFDDVEEVRSAIAVALGTCE